MAWQNGRLAEIPIESQHSKASVKPPWSTWSIFIFSPWVEEFSGLLSQEQHRGQLAHDRHLSSTSRVGGLLVPKVNGDRPELGSHSLAVARPQEPGEAVDERWQAEGEHLS